jgi:hypothetical protein
MAKWENLCSQQIVMQTVVLLYRVRYAKVEEEDFFGIIMII